MKARLRGAMGAYLTAAVLVASILAGRSAPLAAAELKNGGTMTVAYKNEMSSLDPAIGYDGASWNLIRAVFDGLMGYKVGTTDLTPGLAESYSVSEDGLTYTFKLRAGVKFHNGRALTAEDARYAIDRVVDPKTKSPGQQFFASIAGFDERAKGSSDRIAGVRAIDDRTLEIKLAHPDASFLHIMAMNFSYPVPREEVEKAGADFGKHPVGTGAFKVADWRPGQQLVLERNADYWQSGLPHLDKVVVNVGIEPLTAFLQFQRGEVDVLGDGIPTAKFNEVVNDPAMKDQVITGPRLRADYITMKTTTKPFDDKRVRQAVNHAINKARLVQLISGRAVATNQILPPLMATTRTTRVMPMIRRRRRRCSPKRGIPTAFRASSSPRRPIPTRASLRHCSRISRRSASRSSSAPSRRRRCEPLPRSLMGRPCCGPASWAGALTIPTPRISSRRSFPVPRAAPGTGPITAAPRLMPRRPRRTRSPTRHARPSASRGGRRSIAW